MTTMNHHDARATEDSLRVFGGRERKPCFHKADHCCQDNKTDLWRGLLKTSVLDGFPPKNTDAW